MRSNKQELMYNFKMWFKDYVYKYDPKETPYFSYGLKTSIILRMQKYLQNTYYISDDILYSVEAIQKIISNSNKCQTIERRKKVLKAMKLLTRKQARSIFLHRYKGLIYFHCAARLGIKFTSFEGSLRFAMKKFRKMYWGSKYNKKKRIFEEKVYTAFERKYLKYWKDIKK